MKHGKILALSALLALIVCSPLALARLQDRRGVGRVVLSPALSPAPRTAEAARSPWDSLALLDSAAIVLTTADMQCMLDGARAPDALAHNALVMELQGHLRDLQVRGALPVLDVGRPLSATYRQDIYMDCQSDSDALLSVWVLRAAFDGFSAEAVMDARAAFLYELRLSAREALVCPSADPAQGFLDHLLSAFPRDERARPVFGARAERGEREIRFSLTSSDPDSAARQTIFYSLLP